MKYLEKTIFPKSKYDNLQYKFKFPNGYGASVIIGEYTYGGALGKWELAVLDESGSLCYDTPITSDVIGHLTWRQVEKLLKAIREL